MLYKYRECFTKGHLSGDDLFGQLNALELQVKLKQADLLLPFILFETRKSICQSNV